MQPKQILKRKPISTVAVEDDDMSDVPFPMANQQEFLFPEGKITLTKKLKWPFEIFSLF